MDIFKKIYTAIIFMTILSLGYLCLVSIDVINVSMSNETSIYIMTTAMYIFIMSILFSRTANVIANRNARVIGYLATFIGLINLLLIALQMIINNNEFIIKASNIMMQASIFSLLIVLVFEVPRANTSHGKFQTLTAIIIAITIIFPYATGLKKFNNNILYNITSSYELDLTNTDNVKTLKKVNNILKFLSIGTFILNPMLRVFYIDKDYTSLRELDETFETVNKYQTNAVPNPYTILSDKYKKETAPQPVSTPTTNYLPDPLIDEIQSSIQEIPQEKVLNEQYHPEELPEAIIPSIGIDSSNSNVEPITNNRMVSNINPVTNNVELNPNPNTQVNEPVIDNISTTNPVTNNVELNTNPNTQVNQPVIDNISTTNPVTNNVDLNPNSNTQVNQPVIDNISTTNPVTNNVDLNPNPTTQVNQPIVDSNNELVTPIILPSDQSPNNN